MGDLTWSYSGKGREPMVNKYLVVTKNKTCFYFDASHPIPPLHVVSPLLIAPEPG